MTQNKQEKRATRQYAALKGISYTSAKRQLDAVDLNDCQGEGKDCYVHGEACRFVRGDADHG